MKVGIQYLLRVGLLLLLLLIVGCGTPSAVGQNYSTARRGATSTPTPTAATTAFQPQALPTPIPTARPRPTQLPPATGPFSGLVSAPGTRLSTDAQCVSSLKRTSREPRADNVAANHRVPTTAQLAAIDQFYPTFTQNSRAKALSQRITGSFSGTTDEIIQWAACKWGVSADLVRAQAVVESYWHQNTAAGKTTDRTLCAPGTWTGSSCPLYYGLLQITYRYYPHEWPMMRDNTAFNADYVYGALRMCYEGLSTYFARFSGYRAGDIWGCIGGWYSGQWYDAGANQYIQQVKSNMAKKTWTGRWF